MPLICTECPNKIIRHVYDDGQIERKSVFEKRTTCSRSCSYKSVAKKKTIEDAKAKRLAAEKVRNDAYNLFNLPRNIQQE